MISTKFKNSLIILLSTILAVLFLVSCAKAPDFLYVGPTLWQKGQQENGIQTMDYVWQTVYGKFIVLDSGGTDGKLESYMLQNAKGDSKSNQETIVEGIFITHAYSDHFLGIVDLINNSDSNNIKINNIYFNFPSYDWLDMIDKENEKRDELQQALTKAETQGTQIHSDIKPATHLK